VLLIVLAESCLDLEVVELAESSMGLVVALAMSDLDLLLVELAESSLDCFGWIFPGLGLVLAVSNGVWVCKSIWEDLLVSVWIGRMRWGSGRGLSLG